MQGHADPGFSSQSVSFEHILTSGYIFKAGGPRSVVLVT